MDIIYIIRKWTLRSMDDYTTNSTPRPAVTHWVLKFLPIDVSLNKINIGMLIKGGSKRISRIQVQAAGKPKI